MKGKQKIVKRLIVKAEKKNPKNKNMDASVKIEMREKFVKGMVE